MGKVPGSKWTATPPALLVSCCAIPHQFIKYPTEPTYKEKMWSWLRVLEGDMVSWPHYFWSAESQHLLAGVHSTAKLLTS
jgi:hypothetical protein